METLRKLEISNESESPAGPRQPKDKECAPGAGGKELLGRYYQLIGEFVEAEERLFRQENDLKEALKSKEDQLTSQHSSLKSEVNSSLAAVRDILNSARSKLNQVGLGHLLNGRDFVPPPGNYDHHKELKRSVANAAQYLAELHDAIQELEQSRNAELQRKKAAEQELEERRRLEIIKGQSSFLKSVITVGMLGAAATSVYYFFNGNKISSLVWAFAMAFWFFTVYQDKGGEAGPDWKKKRALEVMVPVLMGVVNMLIWPNTFVLGYIVVGIVVLAGLAIIFS